MNYKNAWCEKKECVLPDDEVMRYINVRPSERQLIFNDMKYYSFIHFGMNTFTNREWGDGSESPSMFNPSEIDTDQWCKVLKESGSTGIIFTAKHHDGFCLFDTKYTSHSVMNSPFGKDVVKMLSQSCKKYGLKLGLYLSPWDRHEKTYGSDEYNTHFKNQLKELCTSYGDIFCFWFDGACGEGANGRKQCYAWDGYYEVIRKYQPNAIIANCGPDVRWIGNEGGKVRKEEWSVIPWTDRTLQDVAEASQTQVNQLMDIDSFDRVKEDLGSRRALYKKSDLRWCPAEADVSVTYGWFWHDDEYYKDDKRGVSRSPEELADIYCNTVGGNASLILNVPPDNRGLISDREIATLKKWKEILDGIFEKETHFDLTLLTKNDKERTIGSDDFMIQNDEIGIRLKTDDAVSTIVLEEDIKYSQRVEKFEIYADGKLLGKYRCIGSGKIIRLKKSVIAENIDIIITESRCNPVIRSVKLYK